MQRRERRALARRLSGVTRGAETRYVQDLRGVVRGLHRGIAAAVDAHLVAMSAHRSDARVQSPLDMGAVLTHFVKQAPGKLGPLFDRMAAKVDRSNREAYETLIPIKLGDVGVRDAISKAREDNIRLVEDAGRAYAQDVRDIMGDPRNFGRRVEDLRDELLARGGVSESRAALIARDQTLKLNGAITAARQQSAGVTEYVWSTSKDERVRDTHRELEGQRFSWDSPPEPGHPGQDFQCRCVAVPYVPELDDTAPAPEAPAPEPEAPSPIARDVLLPDDPAARAHAERLVQDIDHPAITKAMRTMPLDRVEIRPQVVVGGRTLGGGYLNGEMFVSTEVNYGGAAAFGEARTVHNAATTQRESLKAVFSHEFGHHLHRWEEFKNPISAEVDRVIQKAYDARTKVLTGYGDKVASEYFAEAFAAYVTRGAELRAYDAAAYHMVEDVLRLRGLL